jgi:HSP20 family protein
MDFEVFPGRIGRMLSDRSSEGAFARSQGWVPAVNVQETVDEMILTAELPGMGEGDIELEVKENVLTLRGEKIEERVEESGESEDGDANEEAEKGPGVRHLMCERRYGAFKRSFTLPRTVNGEEITARFKDGILHVHLPKVPEAKSRKIDIRTED